MREFEIEVLYRSRQRIRLYARDEQAAQRGAKMYATGYPVVVESVDVLDERIEAHSTTAEPRP